MITIERASKTESLAIEQLDKTAWDQSSSTGPINDSDITWRLWIEHAFVFTAKDDSKVVGAALAFPTLNDKFCLHKIFIHNRYRNSQIASRLVASTLHEIDSIGSEIFVNIFSDNEKAIYLFEKHGFYRSSEQADTNRLTNTILMTRPARDKRHSSASNYLASIYK